MNTRPGAQLWIVSTKGDDASAFLDGYIAMGEESLTIPGTRVCIVDYGIGDDVDPEDLDAVAAAHPAYGHTLTMVTLVDALADFRPDPCSAGQRVRARLRQPVDPHPQDRHPAGTVDRCRPRPRRRPHPCGPRLRRHPRLPRRDRRRMGRGRRGRWAEVLYAGANGREFPALLAKIARSRRVPIGYDPVSLGTLDVVDALARNHRDVKLTPITTAQYGSACLLTERAILAGTFRHTNQPDLTAAVDVLVKRPSAMADSVGAVRRRRPGR